MVLSVWRLAFGVWRLAFGVLRSLFPPSAAVNNPFLARPRSTKAITQLLRKRGEHYAEEIQFGFGYVRKQISKSALGEAFAGFSHLRKPGRNHRPHLERSATPLKTLFFCPLQTTPETTAQHLVQEDVNGVHSIANKSR